MFSKKRVFLDYAAGALANPSSAHEEGRQEKQKLEDARTEIARLVECKADDVIITSGATEANALAILGYVSHQQSAANRKCHVLYLPSAHASIVENVKMLEARGVEIEPLPIANGRVDIMQLGKMLRPETALVTMEAVCGETGTIWNTREVATTLQRYTAATPLLHVDASQAVLTEKISRSHFGADLLTLDGGKLGARGAGCLVAHRTIALAPLYGGGGQERELRSGTENVAAIVAFAKALGRTVVRRDVFNVRAAELRAGLMAQLAKIPNLIGNAGREVAPHIVNISLSGRDTDYLVALLDEAGFAVSTKSACESGSGEGSRAVLALTGDVERAAATLRISFGTATSSHDLARFAAALSAAVQFVDSTSLR